MKALFLALQSFQELVAGHRVAAMCDNSTVVAYVNKQGGMVSRSLCSLASQFLRWSKSINGHLDARDLPGQSSVMIDLLSHWDQVLGTEWSLHPQVAEDLLHHWGSPLINLFATRLNAKLPLHCSLVPDPQVLFKDVSSSLGQPGPVRVSTLSSGRKGGGSSQRDTQSLHDSGCPPLAGEGVVRRPSSSTDSTTSGTSVVVPIVAANPLQQVPQQHPRAEPSLVATRQCLIWKSGFSRGCAVEMFGCV